MSVTHKTGPCPGLIAEPAVTFPYKIDDFQGHSFNAMESGEHVLVTAHTGSGKTTVAEYAVGYGLKGKKKVIYTAPIKALSNQIFGDFHRKYPNWSLGIKTGDIDFRSEEAQVIIMTTEILQNMLYRIDTDDRTSSSLPGIDLKDVAVVVFDEVHYIKDRERGSVWERSIMMMPDHIQMIMLSATLPDADKFCQWIATCKGRNITHTTTAFRAVPLTHYMLCHNGKRLIMDKNNDFKTQEYCQAVKDYSFLGSELNHYVKMLQLPALFFCFSKKLCQDHAHCLHVSLVSPEEQREIDSVFTHLLRQFHPDLLAIDQTQDVQRLVVKGVCYHHAGLLPPLKEIIQELFSRGLIKILFVTETFAAGVNMPAKTVVFTGFSKYDNHVNGFRTLLPEEYGQMSGRAGRRGMDTVGTVIHLPFNKDRMLTTREAKGMMCGAVQNIVSRIRPSYHHIFNAILGTALESESEPDPELASESTSRDKVLFNKGSLLEGQHKSQIGSCLKEIQALESEMIKVPGLLEEFSEEFKEKIAYYEAFHAKTLKKRDVKNYHKSGTEEWYLEHRKECLKYQDAKRAQTAMKLKLDQLTEELDALRHGDEADIDKAIDFLCDTKYLFIDGDHVTATIKGIMAAGINEANNILLTELIVDETMLADLPKEDLIAVLAIFLESKEMERESVLPKELQDRVHCIELYAWDLERKEWAGSSCISNWTINKEFCDMAYLWAKGHTVGQIYSLTQATVQVGEFVRMMIKLNNICKETLKAAQLCHKDMLCKTLSECHELLIRDVVTPQSLYVGIPSSASLKKG